MNLELFFARARYNTSNLMGPEGPVDDKGKYLIVWKKIAGKWKAIAGSFSSDLS